MKPASTTTLDRCFWCDALLPGACEHPDPCPLQAESRDDEQENRSSLALSEELA